MDKREMIERALGEFLWAELGNTICGFDALAEQAIAIEAKVSHETYPSEHTAIDFLCPTGHHGTPGKALAIIVSLGEEDGD